MIPDNKGLIYRGRDHGEKRNEFLLRDKWPMSPNKVWIMLPLIKGQDAAKQFSLILQPHLTHEAERKRRMSGGDLNLNLFT